MKSANHLARADRALREGCAVSARNAGWALGAALLLAAPSFAQRGASDGEWRSFGGDLGNTKYSALDQITRDNVTRLAVAWTWNSPSLEVMRQNPRVRPGQFKVVPIVARGRMYVATEVAQAAAIDPATGATLWLHDPESWRAGRPANVGFQHRGVAYWNDGAEPPADERIFLATHDRRLIALDARTGQPIPSFGAGGSVDLAADLGRPVNPRHITHSSPPAIAGDVVLVGSIVSDGPTHTEAPPGHVRGYDARTGAQRWIFHTIAQPGEPGHDTWEGGSWEYTGAANVWSMMAVDPELGYVYLPTGTPTNDFYGGHRLGNNLFAESIVCLEAKTGRHVWHFQAVHHGAWDYDFPTAPNLVDLTVDGKTIPAIAQVSKQAFTYVLDRRTGEPVWPILERPVPQSTVPGERSAPTQPFPTKPPPFDRQGVTEDDLIDFTPELRAEALAIAQRFQLGPVFSPQIVEDQNGKLATLQLPGAGGGANWQGAAFDPETQLLYVPSATSPSAHGLTEPDAARSNFRYTLRSWFTGADGPQGLPLVKPPWGRVTAIDLGRGEHRWMTPHGDGPRDHPALRSLALGPLGDAGGAPLVTRTLLFVTKTRGSGAGNGPVILVYDKSTGERLAALPLPENPWGNPITYLHAGRQYLVVAVGGGPFFSGGFSKEELEATRQNDPTAAGILEALDRAEPSQPQLVAFALP